MRRFKDYLNKFTWGKGDVDHEKKPKKETKVERASKFVWGPDDLEHHVKDIKENLDEKFQLATDHKGNFGNPHQIAKHGYDHDHPHGKANEPQKGDEAHDEFLAHHENLDGDELESINHYKGSGHSDINEHLRGAARQFKKAKKKHFKQLEKDNAGLKFKDEPEHHKDLKSWNKSGSRDDHDHDDDHDEDDYHQHRMEEHIHNLDNVTNHRTTEHHTVYRGGHPGDKTKFPIGHEFTDHGYSSTSFRREIAKNFASSHPTTKDQYGHGDHYKTHLHVIHVPKGSRGHYFDVEGDDAEHNMAHEKEFVLHRGTRFKVTHHSEDSHHHYIHTRVIKQGIRNKFTMKSKQKKPGDPQPKDDHGLPGQQKFPFMKHHKRFK